LVLGGLGAVVVVAEEEEEEEEEEPVCLRTHQAPGICASARPFLPVHSVTRRLAT
jgi:hypothetical protein